eukprot:scaffold256_cov57-Attheya_sp.AAC.2
MQQLQKCPCHTTRNVWLAYDWKKMWYSWVGVVVVEREGQKWWFHTRSRDAANVPGAQKFQSIPETDPPTANASVPIEEGVELEQCSAPVLPSSSGASRECA